MGDLPKWDCPAKRKQCCGKPFSCPHPWPAINEEARNTQKYIVKIGHIYLEAVRQKGYGFSSERADAREYRLEQAEQIAGDIIAKGFALDAADVAIESVK